MLFLTEAQFGHKPDRFIFKDMDDVVAFLTRKASNTANHSLMLHYNITYGGEPEVSKMWKITNPKSKKEKRILELHDAQGVKLIDESGSVIVQRDLPYLFQQRPMSQRPMLDRVRV